MVLSRLAKSLRKRLPRGNVAHLSRREFLAGSRRRERALHMEALESREVLAHLYFQGFETNTVDWNPAAVRVASGTNGIASSTGAFHATAAAASGAFTRWGSYTTPFPVGGYTTSISIYLDVSNAGAIANDTRFDFTSAINNTAGAHLRDFAFNAGFYNNLDMTGPGAGTDRFVFSASNNTGGSAFPKNPARSPIAITTEGWYTFQHRFYDAGGGQLAVDLSIKNAAGVSMGTWTLSDPTDIIGSTVGGNRYGWFATNQFASLAFDDSYQLNNAPPSTTYVDDSWASVPFGSDPDGGGPALYMGYDAFSTVQGGINAVADGGTVNVLAGTYSESPQITNKGLTLDGEGRDLVTINLLPTGSPGTAYLAGLNINSAGKDVTIDGITVVGNDALIAGQANSNIVVQAADEVVITNSRLRVAQTGPGTTGDDGFGIISYFSAGIIANKIEVTGTEITPANASGRRAFFINSGVDDFEFSGNTIVGSFTSSAITQAREAVIEDNTITGAGAPGSRSAGLGTFGFPDATLFDAIFRRNTFTNVGTAITVNGSNDVQIEGNVFSDIDLGVRINTSVTPGYDPSTIHINENSFTNVLNQIVSNGTATTVDASENWWDTNDGSVISTKILGPVDQSPWLNSGSDASPAPGFQGDYSVLTVDDNSPQSGVVGRIQEAIDLVSNGGTVKILGGSYSGGADAASGGKDITLSPGASPAQVILVGDLILNSGDTLVIELTGTNPLTEYDNFVVTGMVTLGGATLSATAAPPPTTGSVYTIIDNDLADPVNGTFAGLINGASFLISGTPFRIFYTGGTGNDVVLMAGVPSTTYADDDWAMLAPGSFILDADSSQPGNQNATFGYDAFATVQQAIDVVIADGTGRTFVNAGMYAENLVLNKSIDLEGAQVGVDARGRIVGAPNPMVEAIIAPVTGMALDLQLNSNAASIDGLAFIGSFNGTTGVVGNSSGTNTGLQFLNNHVAVAAGFTTSALFMNRPAEDATFDQNEFIAASGSAQAVLFDGPDSFDGLHFTNNNVLRSGSLGGTGFIVDGNRNIGTSGLRSPLIAGNLFQNHALGFNAGQRSFENAQFVENTFTLNTGGFAGGPLNSTIGRNTFSSNSLYGLRLTAFGNTVDPTRGAQNTLVTNNVFTGNGTTVDMVNGYGDIRIDDQFNGTQSTNTITNNSLGSTVGAFNRESNPEIVNFSGNWWGTVSNPELAGKILGVAAANIDYTPWLNVGTDTDLITAGFQGDFSYLHIDDDSPQSGATDRIQEAVNLLADGVLTGGARTIEAHTGTYTLVSDITLNKSLTLLGPNSAISPVTGVRVAEATINGAGGLLDGVGGFSFVLAAGITELTVDGLSFTGFDGSTFESSLVPVTDVTLHQNIFTGNNGGLFYKFDTSVATDFDVVDNRFENHSMSGVNQALFHLGNVADSQFGNNRATNISSRELFNIYHSLTNSTFDNNELDTTGGLVGIFANASNIDITDNEILNTDPAGLPSPIMLAPNGQAITDVLIDGNTIQTVIGDSGIINLVGPTAGSSLNGLTITNNTIQGTLYGVTIDTYVNGNGTIADVTIADNDFIDNSFDPILAYSRTNGGGGLNSVGDLTVQRNTFSINAAIYTASFYLLDFRNIEGTNVFDENMVIFSGALPGGTDAIRALAIRGSRTGTFHITENDFDGGGVVHNNSPTVFVSGIAILANDATTGPLPATAEINITNNFINGFQDGIVIRDGVAGVYGNLPAGVDVNVNNNDLSGNSLFALRGGALGETVDASANWWGTNTVAGVPAETTANVDYTPWLHVATDTNVAAGFQGSFVVLNVDDDSPQVGAVGRITEAYNLLSSPGTINIHAGTYTETVDMGAGGNKAVNLAPGASPAQVVINGDLILAGNDKLTMELDGTSAATDYDNFVVNGAVSLGNGIDGFATLSATAGVPYAPLSYVTLIANDGMGVGADPTAGHFDGLADGDQIIIDGQVFLIFHNGGDGNDVILVKTLPGITPTEVYVEDVDWTDFTLGTFVDGDLSTVPGEPAFIGYNAFNNRPTTAPTTTTPIQDAVDAVLSGPLSRVIVNEGSYPENVTISDKTVVLEGRLIGAGNAAITPAAGTGLTITSPNSDIHVILRDINIAAPTALNVNTTEFAIVELQNLNTAASAAGGSITGVDELFVYTRNDASDDIEVNFDATGKFSSTEIAPTDFSSITDFTVHTRGQNDLLSAKPTLAGQALNVHLIGGLPNPGGVPMGDAPGDKLTLDMSDTTGPVVVSTVSGFANSTSHRPLTFAEIEDIDLIDDGLLTNVVMGDLYVRGTAASDTFQFTQTVVGVPGVSPTQLRVRINNQFFNLQVSTRTVAYGRGGNDYIQQINVPLPAEFYGEGGDDYLTGYSADDLLVGGAGNDRLLAGNGDNTVWGDDIGAETGLDGNDQITTGTGMDTVYGGGGRDIINTGGGDDYVFGGSGNDQIDGQAGNDRLYGGDGDDVIGGSDGNDLIAGNGGNDRLYGKAGNDVVIGGDGADIISGDDGNDLLFHNQAGITDPVAGNDASTTRDDVNDMAMAALLSDWGLDGLLNLVTLNAALAAADDGDIDNIYGGIGTDTAHRKGADPNKDNVFDVETQLP